MIYIEALTIFCTTIWTMRTPPKRPEKREKRARRTHLRLPARDIFRYEGTGVAGVAEGRPISPPVPINRGFTTMAVKKTSTKASGAKAATKKAAPKKAAAK